MHCLNPVRLLGITYYDLKVQSSLTVLLIFFPSNYLSSSEINGVCQDIISHRQNCSLACTAMQISAVQIILVFFIALYRIACLRNKVFNGLVQYTIFP